VTDRDHRASLRFAIKSSKIIKRTSDGSMLFAFRRLGRATRGINLKGEGGPIPVRLRLGAYLSGSREAAVTRNQNAMSRSRSHACRDLPSQATGGRALAITDSEAQEGPRFPSPGPFPSPVDLGVPGADLRGEC
jgi:hypothetical protein